MIRKRLLTPACFYALAKVALSLVCSAEAAPVAPVFTNDTAANTLSFNDTFGHAVVVGSYNPTTGFWMPSGTQAVAIGSSVISGTCVSGQVLYNNAGLVGCITAGSGTVISVGMTVPSWLSVSPATITGSGTFNVTGTSEPANQVLASPNGAPGALAPRALAAGDIAGLPATLTSGSSSVSGGCTNGFVLYNNAGVLGCTAGGGSGTVTSVGITVPAWLTVTGTPINTAGTFAVSMTSEPQNLFLASPNGSTGGMTPRSITGNDLTSALSAPPAIGNTTANIGLFTTLTASGLVSGPGFTSLFASPPSIGNTAAASGAFTTLSATSTVSGAGFVSLFASPPAIGTTAPTTGAFTTLSATGTSSAPTGSFTTLITPALPGLSTSVAFTSSFSGPASFGLALSSAVAPWVIAGTATSPATDNAGGIFYTSFTENQTMKSVTISNASPAVVTLTGHGQIAGDVVSFLGTLGAPLVASATYYVCAAGLAANTFEISTTSNCASPINTSGASSGVTMASRHGLPGTDPSAYNFTNVLQGSLGNYIGNLGYVNNVNTMASQPLGVASAIGNQGIGVCGVAGCSATWGGLIAAYDTTSQANAPNPLIGLEVDNYANGTDSTGNRVGIQISVGTPLGTGTVNTVSNGILMGGNGATGGGQFVNLIHAPAAHTTNGIVLSDAVFAGGGIAFSSPGFQIDALGNAIAQQVNIPINMAFFWGTFTGTNGGQIVLTTGAGGMFFDNRGSGDFVFRTGSGLGEIFRMANSKVTQHQALTVATLPTCNAGLEGADGFINDASVAPSYNGALPAGGGAIRGHVLCRNSTWVWD